MSSGVRVLLLGLRIQVRGVRGKSSGFRFERRGVRLHPHSLHSHATLLLEWCDKIKLSNLLLPRKSVTIKILQLLSTSGVRVDPLCREPSRRPELYASFSFCSCTSSSACIRHFISQNASFKLFQKVNSPAKPSTYCLLLLIKKNFDASVGELNL